MASPAIRNLRRVSTGGRGGRTGLRGPGSARSRATSFLAAVGIGTRAGAGGASGG